MNDNRISTILLERYHIGEVTNEEKLRVKNALAHNAALAEAFSGLERADNDFRQKFPMEKFFSSEKFSQRPPARLNLRRSRAPAVVWGLCAAALILVIAFPLLIFKNRSSGGIDDRMKGAANENAPELSVYLRDNFTGGSIELADQAGISEGNTIQLAYRVKSGDKYGVIFSIDGRSTVTLHYPYRSGLSTRLTSGKAVPLDEAYTLDDAPDYEMFFFVTNNNPLDVRGVLDAAQNLAYQIERSPREADVYGSAAFKDYELAILTLWKED